MRFVIDLLVTHKSKPRHTTNHDGLSEILASVAGVASAGPSKLNRARKRKIDTGTRRAFHRHGFHHGVRVGMVGWSTGKIAWAEKMGN